MRSTFTGFNTVRSGLFAAQRALDITGHNIANANTKGYSRQRLNQVQSTPMALFGGQGMLGTGVDTLSITNARNEFLDFKYRGEATTLGYWEAKQEGLAFIEAIINEPSKSGITTVMDELFSSFQELHKTPESITTRTMVRERATTFTNTVNHMYKQLEKMAIDLNFEIATTVNSINSYADQIALLNSQIYRVESDGSNANDLRDRRNVLIDELSKLVNVDVVEVGDINNIANNKLSLQINGQPLVYHDRVNKLDASVENPSSFDDQIQMRQIRWANGDMISVKALGGELKGLLDIRDGNSGSSKGVPYYINELNRFVSVFAEKVNEIHMAGFDLKGNTGTAFFTAFGVATADIDPLVGITAKNIKISLDIDSDPNKIAASKTANLLPGDGSQALRLAELRHLSSMFSEGKPEDFIKSLIGNLGVDLQEAIRMSQNQTFLVAQIDSQRMAISSVSMDEELSNMVRFQHAYNAAARMITTIDEMLDVVINRIGIVGR
ncbi:flagellar hook-associated protein FlgK [Alkaliphilus peptidifermentans]|uniref:Flagellar hook-associated protein 1 n=1 Tax=Alkaliphilus peptidifermentans DSM 18978 TaxID=1120976 RepID=A0A1G5JG71_9FIRM|nr:flagellar hook-associated protein FlgK [Alkaliphilus peptidifermentans]SCY86900.1 flagellar hook-associated protein 1 FlgK [Alkaliphilus peptidifermentans DSM 18978]